MRRAGLALGCCLIARAAAAQPEVALAEVTAARALPGGIEVQSGPAVLRVTALSDTILRIESAPAGSLPPREPWAVQPQWQGRTLAVAAASGAQPGFSTAALLVTLDRSPLRLTITDSSGRVLWQAARGRPIAFRGGGFEICAANPPDTHYVGLGDKPGPLDRRGRAFANWNTDAYGWQESTDPLYKTVPFFMALRQGIATGVFLDSTWRSHFDFGVASRDALCFGAEGGPLDLYVIAGPSPKQVLENYTALTGRMKLPPLWSLGLQQSRWSYTPAARVLQVARTYRAQRIPLDAVWLDIDYQDRNRPFTIDGAAFPDLPGLVGQLGGIGVRVVAITDLHIARLPDAGYAPYDSGLAGDHFVRAADGSVFVGRVWPGPAVFPDFARAATRQWWGALYRRFALDIGIAGFWNDMNEPVVFDGPDKTLPLDARHRIEEPGAPARLATHREIHNAYGMLNARATAEGLGVLAPDRRAFVLTRATFAGGQRDAAVWTGDNSSTWNHLRLATPQLLSLGLSGFAFAGADVGGFRGSASPALLTRWIEVGAFTPFFRIHTEKGSADQEAYVGDPEEVGIRRRAIEQRYRLLPYLYTVAEEAARTGVPIMRPLLLEFPAAGLEHVDSEFLFGPSLLVAPPPDERPDPFPLLLPAGTDWFDWYTGVRRAVPGTLTPAAARLAVFVRAGAIIPLAPLVQSTAETPHGDLELRVYPGPDCHGSVYLDDGITLGYTRGDFLRQSFACAEAADGLHLRLGAREGTYAPWWHGIDVAVFGQAAPPAQVRIGTQVLPASYDAQERSVRFTVGAAADGTEIVLAR